LCRRANELDENNKDEYTKFFVDLGLKMSQYADFLVFSLICLETGIVINIENNKFIGTFYKNTPYVDFIFPIPKNEDAHKRLINNNIQKIIDIKRPKLKDGENVFSININDLSINMKDQIKKIKERNILYDFSYRIGILNKFFWRMKRVFYCSVVDDAKTLNKFLDIKTDKEYQTYFHDNCSIKDILGVDKEAFGKIKENYIKIKGILDVDKDLTARKIRNINAINENNDKKNISNQNNQNNSKNNNQNNN
jgi:hypothetical protein